MDDAEQRRKLELEDALIEAKRERDTAAVEIHNAILTARLEEKFNRAVAALKKLGMTDQQIEALWPNDEIERLWPEQ
jgi:phosphotransacetylase